ncbi:sensor histidine kinase [Rothia sp. P5764]|uniref:sensor histidine kinase n=1 Tax=Rothia sp. P5764 TaxID=3402654 RepID=UPI003ABE65BC
MNFSALKNFDRVAAGFSGIWLVFLLYPLSYLLNNSSFTFTQKVVGLICFLLFSLIYLLSFGAYDLLTEPRPVFKTLYWNLLLLLPAIGLSSMLGGWGFYLSSFCVALWAFHAPQRVGIIVGAVIALVMSACLVFFYRDILFRGGYGFITGSIFVLVMATLSYWADLRREREEELARAQQAEHIARDVHDILGHSLTVINLKAELAAALATAQPEKARDQMQEVAVLSRTALAEVRATVTRMKSPDLAGQLEAARRALETAQIRAHLPEPARVAIAGNNATLFSWVLREAITNVLRHSSARNCWVNLDAERIEIIDDGTKGPFKPGNGLLGLQARVQEAGGDLLIAHGSSTRLLATMNGDTSPLTGPGGSA